jgi:hypothetical protein
MRLMRPSSNGMAKGVPSLTQVCRCTYWHDIHGLDVLRWGENGSSGWQGLHHHVNPIASHKCTEHEWDSHSCTMIDVGIHRAQSVTIYCTGTHFCVPRKGDKH